MANKSIHFKAIPNINGRDFSNYKVSDKGGLVLNIKNNIIMQTPLSNCNYREVCIYDKEGKKFVAQVARLVALAWCENSDPEHFHEVDHIDNNKSNNDAENLRWTDRKGNMNNPITLEKNRARWKNPEWRAWMISRMKEGRKKAIEMNKYLMEHQLF